MSLKIGVLALQGAYVAHAQRLEQLGAKVTLVRDGVDLDGLDGIVLPGGESTTILRFLQRDVPGGATLMTALASFVKLKPAFGTCAGLILLAQHVEPEQASLGALDVSVERNAYGRQLDSRILRLDSELPGGQLEAVFIRAPRITRIGAGVTILAQREGVPVLVREGHVLGCAFHPELGSDTRVHELFLHMCATPWNLPQNGR